MVVGLSRIWDVCTLPVAEVADHKRSTNGRLDPLMAAGALRQSYEDYIAKAKGIAVSAVCHSVVRNASQPHQIGLAS